MCLIINPCKNYVLQFTFFVAIQGVEGQDLSPTDHAHLGVEALLLLLLLLHPTTLLQTFSFNFTFVSC